MPTDIKVSVADRAMWIELDRPEARNAIRKQLNDDLLEALDQAKSDPEVRSIVITSNGPAFCAGGDVKEMGKSFENRQADINASRHNVHHFHRVIYAIRTIEKPIIAAVNGPCYGAGCNLALLCDLRVASEKATFCWGFVQRGLTSDGSSTYFLPRLVGYPKAFELLTLADTIKAGEAFQLGIVNKVVPHETLQSEAKALADRYAASPPTAVAWLKRGLNAGMELSLPETLENEANFQAMSFTTDEFREGVTAFLEKREPKF